MADDPKHEATRCRYCHSYGGHHSLQCEVGALDHANKRIAELEAEYEGFADATRQLNEASNKQTDELRAELRLAVYLAKKLDAAMFSEPRPSPYAADFARWDALLGKEVAGG
jgi:ribosomal protein L44E